MKLSSDEYLALDRSGDFIVLFNKGRCRSCKKISEQIHNVFIPDGVTFVEVVPDYKIIKEHGLFIFPSVGVFRNKVEFYTHLGVFKNDDDINKFNLVIRRVFNADADG
jgi:hypothetical protein